MTVLSFLWCFFTLAPALTFAAQERGHLTAAGATLGPLPISLGKPAGCPWPTAEALSDGGYPGDVVVAGGIWCGDGTNNAPYQWRDGAWLPLDLPDGASAMAVGFAISVSDGSQGPATFVYRLWDGGDSEDFYAVTPGAPPIKLPTLPETIQGNDATISARGDHIVGVNGSGDWFSGFTWRAVRWTRDGENWSEPEDLAPGMAVATTEDGRIVIGNSDADASRYYGAPWIWEEDLEGGQLTLLDPDAFVQDITHDGSMIVGSRPVPCSDPTKCDVFPRGVYWVRQQDDWVMHDLEALDGVTSGATAVALVDGVPIIVGFGYTKAGAIARPLAWLPAADGSYGAPLRLEALGGHFNSFSGATDINRDGLVLGWSELEPYFGSEIVFWSLLDPLPFQINEGVSDAWFNPDTDGQGFFITVWENIQTMFLGWYTFGDGNGSGHYWMTAQGPFVDNRAELEITVTEGGRFDEAPPVPGRHADGTMTVEFSDCLQGTVTYDIPSMGRHGTVPIQRVASDHISNCEYRAAQ